MMRGYRRVARWEEIDDVFQQSVVRLYRCLTKITPSSLDEFFRLATLQLRRELNALAAHYYGPMGLGANLASQSSNQLTAAIPIEGVASSNSSLQPERMLQWTEFHDAADRLPESEKQVFNLIWYYGLNQQEAADIMKVSDRQIRRYWNSARLRLNQLLDNSSPKDG